MKWVLCEIALLFFPCRGRKIYEPPRYMSVNQAAEQLLAIIQNRRLQGEESGAATALFLPATYASQATLSDEPPNSAPFLFIFALLLLHGRIGLP